MTSHRLKLQLIEEFRLTLSQQEAIRRLLQDGFPDCEFTRSRTYLKQLPQQRLLASEASTVIGQLGLEYRVIRIGDAPARILGIIDACVATESRGQGVASSMLQFVENLARQSDVEFLVLFAPDSRLYERHGFIRADNPLRWVKIDEHTTLGIAEQSLDELMVKPVTSRDWSSGLVDLLGYQF